jgi:lysophospholipase L1-like esterase
VHNHEIGLGRTVARLRKAAFVALLLLASVHVAPGPPPVRIMPLGDSITRGLTDRTSGGYTGYRGPLWTLLVADGFKVDFVGSLKDGPWTVDANHEGHDGYRIDQLIEEVSGFLATNPNIVLLHIGTNDLLQGVRPLAAAQGVAQLLDRIHQLSPSTHVIVASVLSVRSPNMFGAPQQLFRDFNAMIEIVARKRASLGWRVSYVDMAARVALQPSEYDSDGTHPNNVGYLRMAAIWRAELGTVLAGTGLDP